MPFFFKPFRIAATTDYLPVVNHVEVPKFSVQGGQCAVNVQETECLVTWRKLHLPEAFDWSRDAISINQNVKLFPDALMSGVRHVQDVAWSFPAEKNIQVESNIKINNK